MADPAFATKWHFMVAPVLFGVHEQTGELLLVQEVRRLHSSGRQELLATLDGTSWRLR